MMHIVPTQVNGNRSLTTIAYVAILTVLIASSCKKKTESSVTDRLMNTWSLVQFIDTTWSSSSLAPMISNYEGKTGEYMDFRKDGKVYSYYNKTYDTAQYTYSEQNYKLNVRAHKYNILILTDNTMILYEPRYSTTSSPGDYTAYKITLNR
jgi:hypothetical protein